MDTVEKHELNYDDKASEYVAKWVVTLKQYWSQNEFDLSSCDTSPSYTLLV